VPPTADARSTNQATDDANTDFVTDQHRQPLLDSSATYVEANVAFRDVILAAQRDGVDNAEIARLTAFSVRMSVAVVHASLEDQ
jgi:hypothetical protein